MPLHVLQKGDRGPEVRELQHRLARKGFACIQDGDFGPATQKAVEDFQRAHDIEADGVVSLATRAALGWPFEIQDEPTDPDPDALGVDVSQFGGIPDYEVLAAKGHTFCIPRLGTGVSAVDRTAAEQIKRSRSVGMQARSGYPYMQSARPGAAQADHFVDLAEGFGLEGLWVDIEPAKSKAGDVWPVPTDAPALARPVAIACLERLRASGFPFGVYGGLYLQELDLPAWVAELPLWASTYGPKVRIPKPWTKAVLWQFAGNEKLGGAVVDLNRAYGGLVALTEALAG